MKWTVIVCVYNSSNEDLKLTLDSILAQDDCDFEVIIADDCSKCDYSDLILNYSYDKRIRYIKNEKNLGTVKNILNALYLSNGEFIKPIGSGDMFYSKNTLCCMYDFMKKRNSKVAFGRIQGYYKDGSTYYLTDMYSPYLIKPYIKENRKNINRNLFLYGDHISGACLFYERNYFIKYLCEIKNKIRYIEDYIPRISVLDGIYCDYIDNFVVYYQMGTGISTKGSTKNNPIFLNDKSAFISIVSTKKNRLVKRYLKLIQIENHSNSELLMWVKKCAMDPLLFLYQVKVSLIRNKIGEKKEKVDHLYFN